MDPTRAWLDSVREEVQRTGCGLVPPPSDLAQFRTYRSELGAELLSRRQDSFPPIGDDHWERLSRIAGQGAIIGSELHDQICEGAARPRVEEACSLLNLLVASFDGVLDERPESVPQLLFRITPAHLDEALDLGRPASAPPVFDHQMEGDPAPGFVALMTEEALRLCRELVLSGGSQQSWAGFATCVRDAYDAEVATLRIDIKNTFVKDEALAALHRKSVLPVTMMGHAVLLSPGLYPSVDPPGVVGLMETLGSLVGDIDDVVDVTEDLDSGRWSFFLLASSGLTGEEIGRLGTETSISMMLERQLPRQVADRIARGLEKVTEQSAGILLDPDHFLVSCRYWLSEWLNGTDSG